MNERNIVMAPKWDGFTAFAKNEKRKMATFYHQMVWRDQKPKGQKRARMACHQFIFTLIIKLAECEFFLPVYHLTECTIGTLDAQENKFIAW